MRWFADRRARLRDPGMNRDTTPIHQDLVLIGGGHSHVIVLRRLALQPLPGVRVTLISKDANTPYSGMLPGYIAGHYSSDAIHIDLLPLCRFANARFYQDEVVGLDLAHKRIVCRNRPAVAYDVLSINVGAAPDVAALGDSARFVTTVKPISRFVARWQTLAARAATHDGVLSIAVVGAGAGGTELVLALQQGLLQGAAPQRGAERLRFHLFASGPQCLSATHPARLRRRFGALLAARGICLHSNAPVCAVAADALITADGQRHAMDAVLWATDASAPAWFRTSGLAVDERGFIAVDSSLESVSHRGLFASGDCAAVRDHPREKAGVFAVHQGKPLAANLRRRLYRKALLRFTPQRRFLSLISTGDRRAAAARGPWSLAPAAWIWRWKDWLDRRFMAQFSDLPTPASALPPAPPSVLDAAVGAASMPVPAALRCGGCGAKVGAGVLRRVLQELNQLPADNTVEIGFKHFDDAAVTQVPPERLLVQSVDGFRAMIDDPYLFGRIVANHALNDIYAMAATPTTALALVTLPYAAERQVEDTLRQLMSGALEVLGEARATLIGGHTGEGLELNLGLALCGSVTADQLLRKSGMRCGERLILTKPIGSGTLFAADMRYRAKGRWIVAALATLQQSNRAAAQCLQRAGASACTDVTGFGLLGHLLEMLPLSASDAAHATLGVTLNLNAIPLMEGALETISSGITSTLQAQNMQAARHLEAPAGIARDGRHGGRYALLFDPQTAGGLLASVPASRATECLKELRAQGYGQAAVIGEAGARSSTALVRLRLDS